MEKCTRTAGYGAEAKEVLERIDELVGNRKVAQEAGVNGTVGAAGQNGDLGALAASLGGNGVVG